MKTNGTHTKVKVLKHKECIIILHWNEGEKDVYVHYLKYFTQEEYSFENSEDVSSIRECVENFCKENKLNLWSY